MSTPGETNPISPNRTSGQDHRRAIEKTHSKSESSWKGRKASRKEKSDSTDALAKSIITESNPSLTEPISQGKKILKGSKGGVSNQALYSKTVKQKIDDLAFRIEEEWYQANDWDSKKVHTPDYSQFLNEEHLFDSLGKFLVENRLEFTTEEKISDFLMEFGVAVKGQRKDTLMRVSTQLIEKDHPALLHFLYLCKDTSAFRTIVQKILPSDMAAEFVCKYATHPEARDAIISLLKHRKEMLPFFFYTTYNRSFSERELLTIGQKIGELDLFTRFIELTKSDTDPHLITHFFNFPTTLNTGEIDKVLKYRLPITHEMLIACITTRNYPGLEKLLASCEREFVIEARDEIFKVLMSYRDSALGAMIHKHAPYLVEMISQGNLDEAATEGNDWFFEWAISNGRTITPQEADELLIPAILAGNIALVKLLFNTTADDGVNPLYHYPADLQLEKEADPKFRQEWLLRTALFSPLEEVYALIGNYPEWAETLEKTISFLPLLVRFPNLRFAQGAGYNETSISKYVNGTKKYAEENLALVDTLLIRLVGSDKRVLPRDTLFQEIVENRFSRLPKTEDEIVRRRYKKFRKSDEYAKLTHITPFYLRINNIGLVDVPVIVDVRPIRYSWCLKHLHEFCYNSEIKELQAPENTSMEIEKFTNINGVYTNSIAFVYPFLSADGEEKVVPTTTLHPQMMQHTPHATLNILQEHLETLHQEIVSYALDINDPENLKLFFEKVARGYWLFATLVETDRGTPHNAMIWLNLVYEHHKLPPPIPRIDHFFLDTTMIVTPIEKAIENWESYFEPALDVALKNHHGEAAFNMLSKLLEKNGNLLKLCSPEARDNDQLVAVAVKTTPSAIQFASKRLHKNS